MRLTALASILLAVAAVAVLVLLGGSVPYARPLFASVAVAALLLSALGMGRRFRVPPLGWIALVFLPAAALCALQIAPLPWHHPWLAPDLALLHVQAPAWSFDAAGTLSALVWILSLAAAALVWHCHVRGTRIRVLAYVMLAIAVLHAVAALVLALIGVDFPAAASGFVARGCFVYYNHAAAFSAACLPLAILLAREQKQPWAWLGVGVLALAVVLSTSRGATLVASAVVLPLAWRVLPRRHRGWWFTALVLAIAGYLAAIGLREVGMKFGRLIGPEGLTLNGRVIIWLHTLPLLGGSGPLGTGANTAAEVWWRTGCTDFPGMLVNHIHSDPLEWLLEFGWLGMPAIIAGLAIAVGLALRRSQKPADPSLYWGALLGLLILALHSCAEFIWNREAIALMAVVLAILVMEARAPHEERQAKASLAVRVTCMALAVAIAACLPRAWRNADEHEQVKDVQAWIDMRQEQGVQVEGPPLERLLNREAQGAELAVAQARLELDLMARSGDPQVQRRDAQARLRQAALLAPADPGAWIERARLAMAQQPPDRQALASDIDRVLAVCPTWSYAQTRLLEILRQGGTPLLPGPERSKLVLGMLALDRPQPPWFFPLAQGIIGTAALTAALSEPPGPSLARSALPWLSLHGGLEQWRERYLALVPARCELDPCQSLLGAQFAAPGRTIHLVLGAGAEERRAQAETVASAGLPVPVELGRALAGDGPLYAIWAQEVTLDDRERDQRLVALLADQLFRGWARTWSEAAINARAALTGATLRLGADSDPRLLVALLGRSGLPGGERTRLAELVDALRRPHWRELPGGHWTWIQITDEQQVLAMCQGFVGWVVDGRWQGWRRGLITSTGLAPGLHRLVALEAPRY